MALRDAGFVDYDPIEGQPEDVVPITPGTRVLFVSGTTADVPANVNTSLVDGPKKRAPRKAAVKKSA